MNTNGQILVVDDEEIMRDVLSALLSFGILQGRPGGKRHSGAGDDPGKGLRSHAPGFDDAGHGRASGAGGIEEDGEQPGPWFLRHMHPSRGS